MGQVENDEKRRELESEWAAAKGEFRGWWRARPWYGKVMLGGVGAGLALLLPGLVAVGAAVTVVCLAVELALLAAWGTCQLAKGLLRAAARWVDDEPPAGPGGRGDE